MIEYNGTNYDLKYNMKRIELIENSTSMPTMAELRRTGGMLGIAALKTYFAYGVKEEGADVFLPTKKGLEMAEHLIETLGYIDVCGIVLEAIERDCPFLFPAD